VQAIQSVYSIPTSQFIDKRNHNKSSAFARTNCTYVEMFTLYVCFLSLRPTCFTIRREAASAHGTVSILRERRGMECEGRSWDLHDGQMCFLGSFVKALRGQAGYVEVWVGWGSERCVLMSDPHLRFRSSATVRAYLRQTNYHMVQTAFSSPVASMVLQCVKLFFCKKYNASFVARDGIEECISW